MAVTGDLVDKPQCLPWITEVLGRLRSRYGSYCVLGNHDLRIHDLTRFRETLPRRACTTWAADGRNCASTASRWFWPGTNCRGSLPRPTCGRRRVRSAGTAAADPAGPFAGRDRLARRHDVDLMLAGHTHGGQIRLPLIGPIVVPVYYGVRYASGVFRRPTLMHVSRGLSGEQALRLNCRPELTKLVLRSSEPIAVPAQRPTPLAPALALPQHGRCCAET